MGLQTQDVHASRSAALMDTLEHQIIPRLMLLHRQHEEAPDGHPVGAGPELDQDEVETFTTLLLQSQDVAERRLRSLLGAGVPAPALCLDLLAPSARHLGELWCADLCDFTQVTIALGRLQGLLRGVADRLPCLGDAAAIGRRALFLSAPGEQHTLGLAMVRDFFRASGWDVWGEEPASTADLLMLLREQRFELIGFSIAGERHVDELAALIARLRKVVAPRPLHVLVGGPLLLDAPALVARLGADATAADARQAILAAESMLTAQKENR